MQKHESEANVMQKSQNDIPSSRDVTIRKRTSSTAINITCIDTSNSLKIYI